MLIWNMANTCSFHRLVGGQYGNDPWPRGMKKNDNFVPLLLCKKEILELKRSLGLTAASEVDTEVNLILARSFIFTCPQIFLTWTYAPHSAIYWELVGAEVQRVVVFLSKYRNSRAADRGIGEELPRSILKLIGIFLPIGSGKLTLDNSVFFTEWNFMKKVSRQRRLTDGASISINFLS